jgi:hypothetical protein
VTSPRSPVGQGRVVKAGRGSDEEEERVEVNFLVFFKVFPEVEVEEEEGGALDGPPRAPPPPPPPPPP